MAEVASKQKRTIPGATMTSVMKYAPQDGFKLSDDILNKQYKVVDVNEVEFNGNKSFMMTLQDEEGNILNVSAAILKRARIIGTSDVKGGDKFPETEHIFTRSHAEEIWNGSSYYHMQGIGMKKNQDFVVPTGFKLRYAVLSEDQETGEPVINPFLYKGYRKVVTDYQKREEFPTLDDFREELLKSEADGRIKGLPVSMTVPTPQNWVKGDVSDYRHTLILEDIAD